MKLKQLITSFHFTQKVKLTEILVENFRFQIQTTFTLLYGPVPLTMNFVDMKKI